MEQRSSDGEKDPHAGTVTEQRTVSEGPIMPSESEVVSTFNPAWRAVQLTYLVFGVIDGLLLIRLLLKLLGANPGAAFANWVYNVTAIFLGPFKSILPTVGDAQSQLEMSVLLAILVYALLGWAIARLLVVLFYRNITVSSRSGGGLRPRGF